MYLYTCMYLHLHMCIHLYTCTYVHIHKSGSNNIANAGIYMFMHTQIYISVYICIYMYILMHICIYMYTFYVCTYPVTIASPFLVTHRIQLCLLMACKDRGGNKKSNTEASHQSRCKRCRSLLHIDIGLFYVHM